MRPQYLYSDLKVSLIRKYMPSIWRACFGNQVPLPELYEPHERAVFERLREDDILSHNSGLAPTSELFQFMALDKLDEVDCKADAESIGVVTHWLGTFLPTCFFPQSRRLALELFKVIGEHSSLELRLQRILPYVLAAFDDKQPKVQAKAIEVAVMIFANLIDSEDMHSLASIDYRVFDSYIMDAFKKF